MSGTFQLDARGEQPILLDLGKPAGRQVAPHLAKRADAFVSNIRPVRWNGPGSTANPLLAGLPPRSRTGIGPKIEAPMFETMTQFVLPEHAIGHVDSGINDLIRRQIAFADAFQPAGPSEN